MTDQLLEPGHSPDSIQATALSISAFQGGVQLYAHIVEQSPASIIITDPTGAMTYANPKFLQVTGYRLDEVLGQNPRMLKGGEMSDHSYKELWATITSGQEWHGEFHNRRKNGSLYWESASISPIRNSAGDITHFIAIKEDITERKKVEAELRAVETLVALGRLASALAHEINNPANLIIFNLPILRTLHEELFAALKSGDQSRIFTQAQLPLDKIILEVEGCLDIIEHGSRRIVELIRQLKHAAGGQLPPRQRVLLSAIAKQVLDNLTLELTRARTAAQFLCSNDEVPVLCHREELEQLVAILIRNALDAMDKKVSRLIVSISFLQNAPPAIRLNIADNGRGIPYEEQPFVFDPFRSSKAEKGFGLGLSLAKAIAKAHRGTLLVKSSPGRGTALSLIIPADL